MEVKPGYKQTEVGVIPEEWDAVPISSLTPQNRKNGIVDGPFGSNLKTIHYRTSGIPIITSGYVTDGKFHADKYLYVDRSKFLEEKRSAVQPGDIVMAKIGERCGASAILPHTHETGILSGNALKITVDELRHSTSFIWQVLWNLHVSGKLEGLRTVGAQPALSMAGLKRFKIPVPPTKAEQRAIATALSDVDGLLGGLDRLIAKKRDLKQAAMQQLLTGQTRLPGFHGEWEMKRLGDVVEKIVGGGTPSRANPTFWGNEIPWVTVKDFATFNPRHSQESITRLGLRNSASHLIPAGTLITSTRMALGKAVVYEVDVAINQDLKALFLKSDISVVFITYWFENFGDMIDELGSGSTVKGISLIELRRFPFHAPSLPEQTAIATVLTEMDAELAALERRREKTHALKQGMMQELLTGRTRLI